MFAKFSLISSQIYLKIFTSKADTILLQRFFSFGGGGGGGRGGCGRGSYIIVSLDPRAPLRNFIDYATAFIQNVY